MSASKWSLRKLRESRRTWGAKSAAALLQRRKAQKMMRRRDRQIAEKERWRADRRRRSVKWALALVGKVNETPPHSNRGPRIDEWTKESGYAIPVPWCQVFVNAVAVHGGCPQIPTGFTPWVLRGNYAGLGFVPVPKESARPGDFVFFKFPGVSSHPCDHVGVMVDRDETSITCVEGNTSPGATGSQNNGGGVWLRKRSRALIAGYVRVPYPEVTP